MAYRRVDESVVHELLRRWSAGEGLRTIARATGLDRKTVRRYAKVADALRLAAASPVDEETVAAVVSVVHHSVDTVSETQHALASERERIRGWLALRVSLADVHARLALGGLRISYATLRRFAIEACGWRVRSSVTRRAA